MPLKVRIESTTRPPIVSTLDNQLYPTNLIGLLLEPLYMFAKFAKPLNKTATRTRQGNLGDHLL